MNVFIADPRSALDKPVSKFPNCRPRQELQQWILLMREVTELKICDSNIITSVNLRGNPFSVRDPQMVG